MERGFPKLPSVCRRSGPNACKHACKLEGHAHRDLFQCSEEPLEASCSNVNRPYMPLKLWPKPRRCYLALLYRGGLPHLTSSSIREPTKAQLGARDSRRARSPVLKTVTEKDAAVDGHGRTVRNQRSEACIRGQHKRQHGSLNRCLQPTGMCG